MYIGRDHLFSFKCMYCTLKVSSLLYVVVVTWARVICLKYTHEHEGAARVRVCSSGKSQVPMLQLIYSTWVNHLQVYMETAGMLCECIYMGPCDFRLWVTS